MKAVLLGGCGAQGSFASRDMVKRNVFDKVVIADLDLEAANKFAGELNSPKVTTRQVDILDSKRLLASIQDADLVVNCTGPYYLLGPTVVDAAIKAGKNYIDFCDDIVAHEEMIKKDQEAKDKGLTILVGLGCSPGIAPLMVKEAASHMDEVEDIQLPQMINSVEPEGPAVVYHMIANFFGQVPVIKDGRRVYQNAFEDEEEIDFGPPLGKAKVSPFGHPEIFTLPRIFPSIKNLTVKLGVYPVDIYEILKLLSQVGLAGMEPLNVKGQSIIPRDFLIAMLMAEPRVEPPPDFVSSMIVEVKGKKDGKAIIIKYIMNGQMGPATGIPCSVGAEWIVQGKINRKGVIFPEECIDPEPFRDEVFGRVREISNVEVKEIISISQLW
jgi:saccharopine dehydrogenase-like NADP-dependent oxidoreductase